MSEPVHILIDRPAPLVQRITLNRPEKRNAISNPLRSEVFAALQAADADPELRVSILRLRYQLSAAVTEETELLAQQREITVELRELRDPNRLRELATKQGFARPERVIQLSVPATGQVETAP